METIFGTGLPKWEHKLFSLMELSFKEVGAVDSLTYEPRNAEKQRFYQRRWCLYPTDSGRYVNKNSFL